LSYIVVGIVDRTPDGPNRLPNGEADQAHA